MPAWRSGRSTDTCTSRSRPAPSRPTPTDVFALLSKGGLAGLFVYHELKLAITDAQADKTLSKLVAPITALQDRIKSSAAGVKSGNTQDLEGTNTQLEQLRNQSAQAGAPVQDQQTNSLSTTGQ